MRATRPSKTHRDSWPPIVVVVGVSGASRENLLATRIADALAVRDLRIAVTRLTGPRRSVSADSCDWVSAHDLADYGYTTTTSCDPRELSRLFSVQMADITSQSPDIVVVELGGTVWRQDVRTMLSVIGSNNSPHGVVLSASDGAAAALGIEMIRNTGGNVAALWTPRADPWSLRRDSRVRQSGVRVCGRGEHATVARTLTDHFKRRWLPLDNPMWNEPMAAA